MAAIVPEEVGHLESEVSHFGPSLFYWFDVFLFVCLCEFVYLFVVKEKKFSPHLSPTQVARTGALDIPAAPIIRSLWRELATHLRSNTN